MAASNRKTSNRVTSGVREIGTDGDTIRWRYILPFESLPGVPARDLTDADVAALDPDLWLEALAHGLYEEAP